MRAAPTLNLNTVNPELLRSMTAIKCKACLHLSDRASVALENAKLSARGSIRRAHDVVTWLGKLVMLKSTGLDPAAVLKRWNDMATRESQVTGNKRVCCLALLDAAPQDNSNKYNKTTCVNLFV